MNCKHEYCASGRVSSELVIEASDRLHDTSSTPEVQRSATLTIFFLRTQTPLLSYDDTCPYHGKCQVDRVNVRIARPSLGYRCVSCTFYLNRMNWRDDIIHDMLESTTCSDTSRLELELLMRLLAFICLFNFRLIAQNRPLCSKV